ncbi:MAG: hypothetical protein QOD99_1447 [Chthoniobacter sp.]|nr:hypothetical protein [Chthoniobacter sp.]
MRFIKGLKVLVAALIVVAAAGYGFYRHQYPYGRSHCCDIALYFSLRNYAESHAGQFPAGEATPEASLSLLHREDPGIAPILPGKTVPERVVVERLRRGELLNAETCGWHYVEGLRMDDNPKLAIFWDKAGLDHNGGRLRNGGHFVYLVAGYREYIPEEQWQTFLSEQQKLLAQRKTK